MAKVSGADVYTAIGVDKAEQTISSGPNQGQPYYRARYDGKGFVITPEFLKDWESGNIVEVNLTESEYQSDDPLNPGEKITRKGWQMTAYGTIAQLEGVAKNEGRLAKVRKQNEIDLQILESQALDSLKLSDKMIAQLKGAI